MTCRPLGCVVGNRWLTSEEEKAEARGHVSRPQGEPEPGRRGRSTQPPEAAEPQHRARRGREPVAARPLPGGAAESTAGKRVATEPRPRWRRRPTGVNHARAWGSAGT